MPTARTPWRRVFVDLANSTVASRDQLAACLEPLLGGERLNEANRERREHELAMMRDGFDDARINAAISGWRSASASRGMTAR